MLLFVSILCKERFEAQFGILKVLTKVEMEKQSERHLINMQ